MAIAIAGERSGVGKTTVTLAMLSYLTRQGWQVQSFKVGPDYIDPMFHSAVTGRPCRNLDPVLTSEEYVQRCFATHAQPAEGVLVEGVMGLFDGASEEIKDEKLKIKSEEGAVETRSVASVSGGQAGKIIGFGSTAHIAKLLEIPVVLVVDCSRMSYSVAALVHGYRSFDPLIRFAGVVLNRVGSDRHLELLRSALEPLNIPILGVLGRHDQIQIPDRHLGLVPTAELSHFQSLVDQLADLAEEWFDWELVMPLVRGKRGDRGSGVGDREGGEGGGEVKNEKLKTKNYGFNSPSNPQSPLAGRSGRSRIPNSQSLIPNPQSPIPTPRSPTPIAIAHDSAFSFYYADNLELLEALGAELVFWSPLKDEELPAGVRGLYLGGGFPEMFARELSANQSARTAVYQAIQAGMPTYAECGGLMYLCQSLTDFAGQTFPMAGILTTTAVMEKRLTLGYRQAIAQHPTPLLTPGEVIWGHEFHHSHLTADPPNPLFSLNNKQQAIQNSKFKIQNSEFSDPNPKSQIQNPKSSEGWHLSNLHASYIHLHWGDRPELPQRFINQCHQFHRQQK